MDEGYFINLTDDEGNSFKLEVLGDVEYEGEDYVVFLPCDMDENDPDYGYVILRSVEVNGEVEFEDIDDQETLEKVYALYMEEIFADGEEDGEEDE